MSYIIESGASTSRRSRRRRALLTLALVALMLFFAFWYAYSYYRQPAGHRAAPTATCTATAKGPLKPSSVTVNVYNATDRSGLAARTATEVRKRGFRVSTVSNDPLQKTVAGPAEVRYGKAGTAGSALVVKLVKGAKAVRDSRTDSSVDLVLGRKFTALAAAPQVKPKPKPKPAATPAATPSTSRTC